jgi:hypothetical protein
MNTLQKYISNLKINTFLLSNKLQHKKKCPQHLKNFDERDLKILYDHEEAVFNHMVRRYLKNKCESFRVIEKLLKEFLVFVCTMSKKYTIILQIMTLLHVSTLSCHPQGACNQYLAKLHKYFKCIFWS